MQAAPLILAGASAGSSLFTGLSGYAEARSKANSLKRDAYNQTTGARETEAIRRDEMRQALGSIAAARAANGLSASSPTGIAIHRGVRLAMSRDRQIEIANQNRRAESTMRSARIRSMAGRASLMSGFLGAVTSGARYGASASQG